VCAECIAMHIDRANEIAMTAKSTGSTDPISTLGLVFMPTDRTPAAGSSFGAGEALDVGLFCFMGQVVDIPAILPKRHPLVVMPSFILIAYPMRSADEEQADLVFDTKVDHLTGRFMSLVTNTSFCSSALLVLRSLQFLPTAGILLATGLLFGKLSKLLGALMFEGTDTTSCDDQGCTHVRRDCREVDFAKVDGSLVLTWSLFSGRYLEADMQFKTMIPDQRTCTTLRRKRKPQDDGRTTATHRQDDPTLCFAHRLRRPMDWIIPLGPPGILHLHVRVCFAKFAGDINVGKKRMHDHLHRLAVQSEVALGDLLQVVASRPSCVFETGLFMHFHTAIPDLRCFHLSLFEATEEHRSKVIELIDANCFHMVLFFFFAQKIAIRGSLSSRSYIKNCLADDAWFQQEMSLVS
jgi:hypothetical protein